MATAPLATYLRTHRKRSGLSQDQIACLIDLSSGTTVSRHEATHRAPTFEQAFAYEVLFGAPASALFPGEYEKARRRIEVNAIRLLEVVVGQPESRAREHRVKFLETVIRRVRME